MEKQNYRKPWEEVMGKENHTNAEETAEAANASNANDDNKNDEGIDYAPTFKINTKNLGNLDRWNLKPGEYPAEITRYKLGIHEDKGGKLGKCGQVTVYLTVRLNDTKVECRKVYYLTDADWAQKQLYFLFYACGLAENGVVSCDWDELVGKIVLITVNDREYNGHVYHNNITRVKPYQYDLAIDDDNQPF